MPGKVITPKSSDPRFGDQDDGSADGTGNTPDGSLASDDNGSADPSSLFPLFSLPPEIDALIMNSAPAASKDASWAVTLSYHLAPPEPPAAALAWAAQSPAIPAGSAAASVETSAASPPTNVTFATSTVTGIDTQIQTALGSNLVNSLYGITGAGEKIGVISDSFNNNGGEATDIANGALPSNMTILHDEASGGTDEGRAMTEVAYAVAPGAQYYFYDGGDNGVTSFATAVSALQAAGCTVIVDDLTVSGEMWYQTGSAADIAINNAVAANVDYFTSAANNGNDYYESGFTPLNVTIPNIGAVTANDFGGASPYLSVTIPTGTAVNGVLGWAQPAQSYGSGANSAGNSLAVYLLDSNGNVVASATANDVGGDPYQSFNYTNNTSGTSFSIVVVQNGGTVPAGELFKFVWYNDVGTINNASAGQGSGTLQGHEFLPGLNSVAAADYATTPAFGTAVAPIETSSTTGPGKIVYDAQGNLLATPIVPNEPQFAAPDGTTTASANSPTFASSPFFGTSAAAPASAATAALMLQANTALTTTQITSLVEQSVTPTSSSDGYNGAGLIQARAAVELAAASGEDRWTGASGGNWTAATWSAGAAPTTANAAYIDDNLGTISGAYAVTVNSGGDVAGSVALAAPAGSSATLDIVSGGSLAVGGSTAANATANDFLVSDNGTLNVSGGGSLSVARSLNVNNGTANIAATVVTAGDYTQDAGLFTLGGSGVAAGLTLTDATGFAISGGTATVAAGATVTTTAVTNSGTIQDSGIITDASTLTTTAGLLSVLTGGMITTTALVDSGTIIDAGELIDTGGLTNGNASPQTFGGAITLQSGGLLSIGGATSYTSLNFNGRASLLLSSTSSSALISGSNLDVSGFKTQGDAIDLTGFAYSKQDSYNYVPTTTSAATGDLQVLNDTGTEIADISFATADNYTNSSFKLRPDTSNNLEVVAACYRLGTRIATGRGEVPVECLEVGDVVLTASGELKPTLWIGHRHIDCRRHPKPERVWPVRVAVNAFGPDLPRRDLWLSPDHAVYVRDVLVPIKLLINGGSIAQVPMDAVTYYHVELPRHDVILADGLPAESYLDTGNRHMFEHVGAPLLLHPNMNAENEAERRDAGSCARLVRDPAGVEPIWHMLAGRAEQLGFTLRTVEATDDPVLRIFAGGRYFPPVAIEDGKYYFAVPRAGDDARLVSRGAVPAAMWPWMDDPRRLGVAVHRIVLRSSRRHVEFSMDDPRFTTGWWQPERDRSTIWRWTNGNAALPFTDDNVLVEVWIAATLSYPMAELHAEDARAAA